jgi:hypothetical protein
VRNGFALSQQTHRCATLLTMKFGDIPHSFSGRCPMSIPDVIQTSEAQVLNHRSTDPGFGARQMKSSSYDRKIGRHEILAEPNGLVLATQLLSRQDTSQH